MYSKENEEKSKEEEFVEVTEEIEETKEIHRNISMTNGKLILKGKVNGNVSVVNSIIEIQGIINGNLNAIRSKIIWAGGKVEGDVNSILSKEEGTPKVSGKHNVIAFDVPFVEKLSKKMTFKSDKEIFIEGEQKIEFLKKEKVIVNGNYQPFQSNAISLF